MVNNFIGFIEPMIPWTLTRVRSSASLTFIAKFSSNFLLVVCQSCFSSNSFISQHQVNCENRDFSFSFIRPILVPTLLTDIPRIPAISV